VRGLWSCRNVARTAVADLMRATSGRVVVWPAMDSIAQGTPVPAAAARSLGQGALIVLSRWRIEAGFILAIFALATARPTIFLILACLPLTLTAMGIRL